MFNIPGIKFNLEHYPTLARQIFTGGKNNVKTYRHKPSRADYPEYRKSGIPVKNPKIAANIQMMHEKWLATKKFNLN